MQNPYLGAPAAIARIHKHTVAEWTFSFDWAATALPGQFVILSAPGAGEAPFTVTGCDGARTDVTVRKVGRVTSRLFERKRGDRVWLRGPYGQPFPDALVRARRLLVVAGGSGLAAVKMLLDRRLENGAARERHTDLIAGFRAPKHVLFRNDLKRWAAACPVTVTVDTTEDEDELWAGGIGFVVDFLTAERDIGAHTTAVLVGPPAMMRNTVRELLALGVDAGNLWLSFERHMQCGIGKCGHCRIGDQYVCLDGPAFPYTVARGLID